MSFTGCWYGESSLILQDFLNWADLYFLDKPLMVLAAGIVMVCVISFVLVMSSLLEPENDYCCGEEKRKGPDVV